MDFESVNQPALSIASEQQKIQSGNQGFWQTVSNSVCTKLSGLEISLLPLQPISVGCHQHRGIPQLRGMPLALFWPTGGAHTERSLHPSPCPIPSPLRWTPLASQPATHAVSFCRPVSQDNVFDQAKHSHFSAGNNARATTRHCAQSGLHKQGCLPGMILLYQ